MHKWYSPRELISNILGPYTPIYSILWQKEKIPLLMDKGAHINRQYEDEINLGFSTPLGLAAFDGHNETTLFLLQKGG